MYNVYRFAAFRFLGTDLPYIFSYLCTYTAVQK